MQINKKIDAQISNSQIEQIQQSPRRTTHGEPECAGTAGDNKDRKEGQTSWSWEKRTAARGAASHDELIDGRAMTNWSGRGSRQNG
jgi:hypothetical protein